MAGMVKSIMCMFVVVVAVFLVVVEPRGEAAIGCGTVVSNLRPCIPYLTQNAPLGGCCGGVRALNSAAHTTPDRQSVCNCLKSVAGSYPAPAVAKAAGLPGTCGVSIPYKISPSTDCSTVQ